MCVFTFEAVNIFYYFFIPNFTIDFTKGTASTIHDSSLNIMVFYLLCITSKMEHFPVYIVACELVSIAMYSLVMTF